MKNISEKLLTVRIEYETIRPVANGSRHSKCFGSHYPNNVGPERDSKSGQIITKENFMITNQLPRNNELLSVVKSKSADDIKPFIEIALDNDDVKAKLDPYLTNGGVEGDKRCDMMRAADIIIKFDKDHGGNIAAKNLPLKGVINQLAVVLRRRYILNNKWKAVDVNPKRYMMLAHTALIDAAPASE
jgi:hypothetical protein